MRGCIYSLRLLGIRGGGKRSKREPDDPRRGGNRGNPGNLHERFNSSNVHRGGYNYNGYEYKVISIAPGKHQYENLGPETNEIYADSQNGTPLNDAIYTRNKNTEQLINIKVSAIFGDDNNSVRDRVIADVNAGDTEYDAILARMGHVATMAQSGLFFNLKDIDSMDVTNPWWDKNIVDAYTLFDSKLYWITGDINVFDDLAAEALFVNEKILEDNGFEIPYADAAAGKWTIDKMYTIAKACELDVDGNGVIETGTSDIVGHSEQNDHIKHWIYAMGEIPGTIGTDGKVELNITSERHIKAIDTLYSYMVDRQMSYENYYDDSTPWITGFLTGNIAFQGTMLCLIGQMRDMEDDFGVLPLPKMDEEQENYGHYISKGWTTAYAIPVTNPDPEQTGTILEVLCGFSTDTVRSALYDTLLTGKLVRNEDTTKMLDIIFSTKSYDFICGFKWGDEIEDIYVDIYNNKNNNYTSAATSIESSLETTVNDAMAIFKDLDH